MRFVGLIDSLCSGGAQRQMTLLARVLKQRGHEASLLVYRDRPFFQAEMDDAGVLVTLIQGGKFRRPLALRAALRAARPDVVVAFMPGPNLYAELAALPRAPFVTIVSERRGYPDGIPFTHRCLFQVHRLADRVVVNSPDLKARIDAALPGLRAKTRTVLNCVDLDRFHAAPAPHHKECRILMPGRHTAEKNGPGIATAFKLLIDMPLPRPVVLDWYGNTYFHNGAPTKLSGEFLRLRDRVAADGLEEVIRFHEPTPDLVPCYHAADAVLLASFYEGCANVLCEAAACGRPVLASNVCSNHLLVRHGVNGYLFNPHDPADMARAIADLVCRNDAAREAMGRAGRALAEELLAPDVFADHWLELINEARAERRA